jgi:hypothetical protein
MLNQKQITRDNAWKKKRAALSEKYGKRELWSVMDHWPLYCGIRNLARSLAIYELYKSTMNVPGHIAEFGSWRGANLLFLAKLLRIHESHGPKVVHGFDSFEGLTEFHRKDGSAAKDTPRGAYKGSFEELKDFIDLYEMGDEIQIHKGLIEKTLPALLKKKPSLSFSFIYCDVDLYQSTKLILELMHPRLSVGGIFAFDEWNDAEFPGETVAVREFLEAHGGVYLQEQMCTSTQPSLILRKIAAQTECCTPCPS